MNFLLLQEQQEQQEQQGQYGGGSFKWHTLEHMGPLFPEDYKPHGKPLKYNQELIKLTKEQEEAAMLYAKYIQSEYIQNKTFNKNFWHDWKKLLGKDSQIKSLEECDFSDYKEFLGPLKLKSTLTDEKLPKSVGHTYVGKMFKPNKEHLEELMYDVVLNYKAYSGYYFAQAEKIHEKYNWIQLTKNAFDHLEKKFS